jgi:hypothetical protein
MTPEQVADLVARTRAADLEAERLRLEASNRPRGPLQVERGTGAKAARFAMERGRSLAFAARRFGCSESAARHQFAKLYPGVPALLSKRGGL